MLTAQQYGTVNIDQPVYEIIETAQLRGMCSVISGAKPYSEKMIRNAIVEILANSERGLMPLTGTEKNILQERLDGFTRKEGLDALRGGYFIPSTQKNPFSADVTGTMDVFASTGLYQNGTKEWGFIFDPTVSIKGDMGTHASYNFSLFGNISRAVLTSLGTYCVGEYWYGNPDGVTDSKKYVNSYANYAYFPFSFDKRWDGSVYKLGMMDASGLEGWCDDMALGFGIKSEVDISLLDDRLSARFGRFEREWAAMENGSSIILNGTARPFLAGEAHAVLFDWLRISTVTGILEFPNQSFIDEKIYGTDDANAFQNAFSMTMVEMDWKYAHADFGTNAVWPKRFELGYLFPLMNKVFYQNDIGDFDNLSLFGDLKLMYPGIGSAWFSLFLDEVNGFSSLNGIQSFKWFEYTRDMFAIQAGTKANLPFGAFTTISVRYTKIEPYCYTHHCINYTPWYLGTYISESYTNNGECLGYYLPPNSDELNVCLQTMPSANVTAHVAYQFIRHGADFGSNAVNGSSLYSELSPNDRDDIKKYFLHDGAYQWFHIIKLGASWSLRKYRLPVTLYGEAGYVYSFFTNIEDGKANTNQSYEYHVVDTTEYPTSQGVIVSGGFKLWL